MIRAHLATFPLRSPILMQTVDTILPQVDRLCICLNDYAEVPPELGDHDKIEPMIPDRDLKDAGKFAFVPAPDDVVFTIDDDILYPQDYVARTMAAFDHLDPAANVFGYQGNAWVFKKKDDQCGWRSFLFHRAASDIVKVDVLGTGTACQLGRNLPTLDTMLAAAGFVDLRHARLHNAAGRDMWILPREQDEIASNMRNEFWKTSLFNSVQRAGNAAMIVEHRLLMQSLAELTGLKLHQVIKRRANAARGQVSQGAPSD